VNNLTKIANQWNGSATQDSNRGHRDQIPSALTTRPLSLQLVQKFTTTTTTTTAAVAATATTTNTATTTTTVVVVVVVVG